MASGSGRPRVGIRIQEPGDTHRDQSNAAAAATEEPPPSAPPSDGTQERHHDPSEAEGGSPSAAAAAAAAAARKGKGLASPPHSPTRSEDTVSSASSDIVPEKGEKAPGESSSADKPADGGERLKVTWKKLLVEATMEVPKVTKPMDVKSAFDNLSLEQQWALAEDMELRQWYQAQQRKSLWSKFKDAMLNAFLERIGRQTHNSNLAMIPHVNHQTIPTTRIFEHYNRTEMAAGRGVIFHSNELNLRRAYSEFRPVLGDGECFYRSFIFSYLEQVLDRQDTHEEHRLLSAVKGVARHHARLGWISEFSQGYKAFKALIKKVMRWKRHNRLRNVPTTVSYRKQKLLKFFSGYGRTLSIFAFLRLVAAIWICSHSEEFEPHIPELNEYDSLRDWCFHQVIKYKIFTDHVQMIALVTALGVPLRVEYLLERDGQDLYTRQEGSKDTASTCWPNHRHQLPHAHVVPRVTVLHTNVHFDIIYPHRRDGPVSSTDESRSQQTAQVQGRTAESSSITGENPDQHAELKSTFTGAHEHDEHKSIAE